MTVAGRLNAYIVAFAVLGALLLLAALTGQAFHHDLDQVARDSRERVAGRADLQWLLYREEPRGLTAILRHLDQNPVVAAAHAYDRTGSSLAESGGESTASFNRLRADRLETETVLSGLTADGSTTSTGFFASLWRPDTRTYLSMPVISTLNPEIRGLQAEQFIAASARPTTPGGSDFVLGYIQVDIDPGLLRHRALARTAIWLLPWFALLAAGLALLALWNRRSLRNLDELASVMDQVAAGDFSQQAQPRGGRELRDMARAVNRLAQSLQRYRKEIEVGRDLLSRKVDERTHQLSRSHEELERATEAASESTQQLAQLTYYDVLTSLPNRRLFSEQFGLMMRLARRAGQNVALLFIDLDNARRINDSLGHHAGDLLLREVAKRLKHSVRDSDAITQMGDSEHNIAVSRLGGDEFTVVLNQLDSPEAAAMVARRIIRQLSAPLRIDHHEITVNPRIGIAIYPGDGDNTGTLLNAAATASQSAKKGKAEGFAFFRRDMVSNGTDRLRVESDLRNALDRGELVLHYQPQVDTIMGSVVAVEALLRWRHPEQGLITPSQFMGVAGETGMIRKIGDWVLQEACQQLKALESSVAQVPRIAVNISAGQFVPGFAGRVKAVLTRTGLAADRLELSLDEQLLSVADEATLLELRELRGLGVYLSLDGYGLGHSSLAQLGHFPLDELKIEREFIADYRDHGRGGPVQALIATARSLELRAAAEGVEARREYQYLAEQGVRLMQGDLFSKPVSLEALLPMLAPWHFIEQIRKFGNPAGD